MTDPQSNPRIDKLCIRETITVRDALKQMDVAGEKVLFVIDPQGVLCGSLTDGDIRRWILKEGSLQETIGPIYHRHPRVCTEGMSRDAAAAIMREQKIEALPVVDRHQRLCDVLFWNDIVAGTPAPVAGGVDAPVLVMAGGKGTRLDPLTKILPKPLIPIGDKPIVELIMDQFAQFGCREFLLTVNYKGKMIQSYFDDAACRYTVRLVWEEEFLGTAGSLRLAAPMLTHPHCFVSNCDILIKADYRDIMQFHLQNDNDITVIGSMQHVAVPYGVLALHNGGQLERIVEKPEYDFLANTGMYLIKRSVIDLVPEGARLDFPDLLARAGAAGRKVKVYPISQQSWIDIGQWQEYQGTLKKLEQRN